MAVGAKGPTPTRREAQSFYIQLVSHPLENQSKKKPDTAGFKQNLAGIKHYSRQWSLDLEQIGKKSTTHARCDSPALISRE
jgi:hypothetical protein